jgi:hypothetical protein
VLGNAEGALTFEGVDYANGDTFISTSFLTAADVTAKAIENYTTEVVVDAQNGKVVVTYTGDEATGIEDISATNKAKAIYDLSGRQVKKASKGVYIVNGQKVVY